MPPPLVGEALADRRVFEGVRFAPICSADILSCLAAVSGFGASATRWKSESYAKGSPTRGAVAAKPATERFYAKAKPLLRPLSPPPSATLISTRKKVPPIKTVIYLDVLLLTNFALTLLFLLAAGLLAGVECRAGRLLLGGAAGATSSLALLAPDAPAAAALLPFRVK